jgi:hypothetical protein
MRSQRVDDDRGASLQAREADPKGWAFLFLPPMSSEPCRLGYADLKVRATIGEEIYSVGSVDSVFRIGAAD